MVLWGKMWHLVDSQMVTCTAQANVHTHTHTQWSLLYYSTYLSWHGSLALGNDCRVGMVINASGLATLCGVLHHCSISISTTFFFHRILQLFWGESHLSVARLYLKACTVYRITQWCNLCKCMPHSLTFSTSGQLFFIFLKHRTLQPVFTIMCIVVTISIQCKPLEHLTTVLKVNRA